MLDHHTSKKSPQIVEIKAADVCDKFYAGKLQWKSSEYLLHTICNCYGFATTINSSAAPSATVWPSFKEEVLRSPIRGVMGVLAGWDLPGVAPIESPPMTSQYLSFQSFAISAAIWPEFQRQIIAPIQPPQVWG